MLCDEVKELLYEYIFNELSEDKRLKVEEHIEACTNCKKEYLELKKLLKHDMQKFIETKEKIVMPKDLTVKINKKLYGTKYRSFSRFAVAASILIMIFYAFPVAAYYIVENTALNKYIDFDKGIIQDIEEGQLQIVDKSSVMKDITFRVDGIIRKKDSTKILFTVKVPKDMDIDYAMTTNEFNTVVVEDQLGKKYRFQSSGITLKSANEDGEATAIMEVEPLKFWAYKLTMRTTALEGGILEASQITGDTELKIENNGFDYKLKKLRNIYGKWEVNFYIDRSNR
jgi:hypothetical protein